MTQTPTSLSTAPARPPRPARRGPADLPFSFADRALAETLAAERKEPAWLLAERHAAADAFDALPVEANNLYTPYIDLRAAKLDDVDPYVLDGPPGLGDDLRAMQAAGLPAGVHVETMAQWLERDPDGFRRLHEGGATLPADDKLAQLARGFWSHGRHVEIDTGTVVDEPIVLRWPSAAPGRALVTRTIITLGDGASAQLVEELVPCGPQVECAEGETVPQGFFHGTTEVLLGKDARLELASIQEFGAGQVAFQHRFAKIGEGATLHWALAQLGGKVVRSRVDNRLEGDRSTVEQVEIVFASDDQLFDLTSYTRHIGRDTTGNLLSKGALLDRSKSFMKGLIDIEKSAVGTDSYLGEFGMNLSRAARAVAIPSLEIDQPDCRRAAHSSSVGPIDPTQLFYLESRGIPPDEARKFIVLGFLEPVVARVPLETARARLRDLLDAKWDAGTAEAASAA
ncbi:MAG TPA: SufD family Fe-S cluster assembly protein [Candidatus Limnocylindrales bacterium]|nr:SufD family Fe-S cluster assembly protein [Candidatus Limnocylindrales bacterium]